MAMSDAGPSRSIVLLGLTGAAKTNIGRRLDNGPRLKDGHPRAILTAPIEKRHPIYAEADIVVESIDGPPELTLGQVIGELKRFTADDPQIAPGASTSRAAE